MPSLVADAVPTWVALTAVASCLLGAALAVPTAPPPDASRLARAVDSVAASAHPAERTVRVHANAVRVEPDRLSLRSDAGTATARFRYGRVVPVATGALAAILRGRPPSAVFDTPGAFRNALARARTRRAVDWHRVDHLHVRHVSWRGVDVTLVG